ncbi:TonB-dependent receptor [Rubrivivax gelatinosus]|uniref:TonB-dependent receptor n=1 Tax=Rubrivivax gelatinosus TaxID=28068 RepID=UPI0002DA29E1|nr:TonB-dependent receptor [Rubrivivax gelatinosus]MBG6082393.1 iron complex outermembrane receptor protein [Rubrivivax gelatinosus]
MKRTRSLPLAVGALLVASAWPAHAQETLVADAGDEVLAAAGRRADEPVGVESITVTARRRSEDAQDVPAPISVLSARDLEAQRLYQVQDLQQALPNVTAQFLHARQSSVSVRGIGNNTANEGLEGSAGIYLDNVFLGRPGQAVFDLLDVEQIDLLRGPQGTMFGKNTTAGVLNITTRAPTFQPEAAVEASLGNRHYTQLKASYSGPLADTVAFRVAAYGTHDDGWLENVVRHETLDEINRKGLRTQLLLKPDEGFSLRLIAEHNQERSSTGTLVPYAFGPLNRGAFNSQSNYTNYADWARRLGATPVVTDPDKYEVALNDEQRADAIQNALSAEANWQLGEHRLSSITAWRNWRFDPRNDIDGTSLPGITGGFTTREKQFSQELRLASPADRVFDYVVGAYYYHQNIYSLNRYDTGAAAATLSGGGYPANNALSGRGDATTDSFALFGQGTLHFESGLNLTGGLRATTEKKQGRVRQNDLEAASPYSALPIFAAWDSGELERRDDSLAALLTASGKLSARSLVYATLSHGEKSGGYNVNSVASPGSAFGPDAITVEPEKANNLELGFKSALLDNRLQVNANLFVTKVRDYQAVTTQFYAPTNGFLQVLTNVGDVTSKGVEFDVKGQLTRALSLSFNGAYTRATFDNGSGPTPFEVYNGGYGRGSQSIAGNEVNGAPKWTANLGAQYRHFVADGVEFYANGHYAWRSSTYGDLNNSVYSRIPSYALVNLAAGWRLAAADGGGWDLSLWVRNAFDKHHYLGLTSVGNNAYFASAGQPRTLGATLRYDFF